jgi:hypothetical protein
MARQQITIEFSFENEDDEEVVVEATAYITQAVRAVIHPVDESHDAEGGEIEDITLTLDGDELPLDQAEDMGLDVEKLEEALYDHYCDQDEEFEEE